VIGRVSQIVGCGSYLPERILTNDELATMVDTSDEWIVGRSGIRQRHVAADGELTSNLAAKAAERALADAGLAASDLDVIIVGTTTPDMIFPATATRVQALLGATAAVAFDIQAACSGFVYGLSVADNFIKAGQFDNALVIGAETFSRIVNWKDRSTCVLFGDGAGAAVLQVGDGEDGRGILSTHIRSDGRHVDILVMKDGPSTSRTLGDMHMAGREVFRHAVVNLTGIVHETLKPHGLTLDDVDWLVPHQANKRILDGTARKLGLPPERVVITIDRHANTSAASVPLALDEAVRDGRIQRGQLVLMEAMGAGLTWGAALVRW